MDNKGDVEKDEEVKNVKPSVQLSDGSRPLSTFPIQPSVLNKLNKAGFISVGNVLSLRPSELSSSAEIKIEDAADVLDLVQQSSTLNIKSALELLYADLQFCRIVTMSAKVDDIINGGISVGRVTEISGTAGVGKTQFCLQLCVTVQIPEDCGGMQSQAVFIDTEGSFNVSRLRDMGEACIKHCRNSMIIKKDWNLDAIISNIYVFHCREITDLISCVMVLKEFLLTHPKVRLIIVDSLAFHFRHDLENAALRSRVLHKIAAQLSALAVDRQIAVVVTNQMTTKFSSSGTGFLTPALGTSWGHAPSCRVLLDWDPSHAVRWATIIKSSSHPSASAPYQVTKDGIRDVVTDGELTPPRIIYEDGIVGTCFDGAEAMHET